MTRLPTLPIALLAVMAWPAMAATNLIDNGSFEQGLAGWTTSNAATGSPVVVIEIDRGENYPLGAYGEEVPVDNAVSASPTAAGGRVAYFSDDAVTDETLSQLTRLDVGTYEFGFSAYLPQNGFNNPGEAHFEAIIVGQRVALFAASTSSARTWINYNGVAEITQAGFYQTAFVFNTPGLGAAKDVVIDRIYAVRTERAVTITAQLAPTLALPEPGSWALMTTGFGLVGGAMRRRTGAMATG